MAQARASPVSFGGKRAVQLDDRLWPGQALPTRFVKSTRLPKGASVHPRRLPSSWLGSRQPDIRWPRGRVSLSTRQCALRNLAAIAMLLVSRLNQYHPQSLRNRDPVEIPRERLFVLVIVQKLSLSEHKIGVRVDPESIGIAPRCVVRRRNGHIEIKPVRSRCSNFDSNNVRETRLTAGARLRIDGPSCEQHGKQDPATTS